MIAAAGLLVLGIEALVERRIRSEREVCKARERELLKLIQGLQNRISAKDLSGYMALQQDDRRAQSPLPETKIAGNDELEAEAERLRSGLIRSELTSILNGGASD